MKKFLFFTVLLLLGVGLYVGYKMAKGEGGWLSSCCGWGDQTDPWTSYAPPDATDEAAAEPAD